MATQSRYRGQGTSDASKNQPAHSENKSSVNTDVKPEAERVTIDEQTSANQSVANANEATENSADITAQKDANADAGVAKDGGGQAQVEQGTSNEETNANAQDSNVDNGQSDLSGQAPNQPSEGATESKPDGDTTTEVTEGDAATITKEETQQQQQQPEEKTEEQLQQARQADQLQQENGQTSSVVQEPPAADPADETLETASTEEATEEQKEPEEKLPAVVYQVRSTLKAYLETMAPGKPHPKNEGIHAQLSLVRLFTFVLRLRGAEFTQAMDELTKTIVDNREKQFNERYAFRFIDGISISQKERTRFRDLLHVFLTLSDKGQRQAQAKTIDLRKAFVNVASTEEQALLSDYFAPRI